MKLIDLFFTEASMTVGDHTQGSSPGPNYGVLGMNATGPAQPDAVRAKLLQGNEPGSANRDEPLDKIKEGFMDDYEDQDHPVVRLRKILASEGTDTIQVVKDIVVNVFSNGPWVFVKSSSDGWLGFPRHVLRFKNPKLQLGLKVTVNLDKRKTCSLFFDSGTLTVIHKSFSFDSEEELRYKLPEYYNMAFAEVNAQTTNEAIHAVSGPVNTDKTWGKDVVHTEKNYKTLTERTNLEESDLIQLVDELIYNLPYGPWEKTKQNKDFYHMIDQYTTNYKNPETNFSMKMELLMKPLNRDYSTRYAQYTGTLFVFNPTGHMGSSHRFLFSADDMESVVYSAFNKAYEDSVKHEYHLGIEESVGRKTNYHKLKEFVDKMVSETLTQGQKMLFDNEELKVGDSVKMKGLTHLLPGQIADIQTFPNGERKVFVKWSGMEGQRLVPLNSDELVKV